MAEKPKQLAKSVDMLVDKAASVLNLAKGQREVADNQHANARELEIVGQALQEDVAALKDKLTNADKK